MELLEKTGLSFTTGQKLTSEALNSMNDCINNLVDKVNMIMKGYLNVNNELGDKTYEIDDFLANVPEDRRVPGMLVVYKNKKNEWTVSLFNGPDWFDTENCWNLGLTDEIIDGGEW